MVVAAVLTGHLGWGFLPLPLPGFRPPEPPLPFPQFQLAGVPVGAATGVGGWVRAGTGGWVRAGVGGWVRAGVGGWLFPPPTRNQLVCAVQARASASTRRAPGWAALQKR